MMQMSKKSLLGLTVAATILGLSQAAEAHTIHLTATLDQDQEIPAPTPVPGASGFANLTYDTHDNLLNWNILFSGLSDDPVAAHFHGPAAPGATAGVQVNIGDISGLTSPMMGSATLTDTQEAGLLSDLWYINIHTSLNPAGEIRGQVNVVPEPLTLLGVGTAMGFGAAFKCKLSQKNEKAA